MFVQETFKVENACKYQIIYKIKNVICDDVSSETNEMIIIIFQGYNNLALSICKVTTS